MTNNTDPVRALIQKWREAAAQARKYAEDPPRLGGGEESSFTYRALAEEHDYRADELEAALAQQPAPPSAPVGVQAVVKAMRLLAGVGIPVKPECVGRWADQLEALAPQPAIPEGWVLVGETAFNELTQAADDILSECPEGRDYRHNNRWVYKVDVSNIEHLREARAMLAAQHTQEPDHG